MEKGIQLIKLAEEHTIAFKEEMQEAFQHGFQAYNKHPQKTPRFISGIANNSPNR